jgi:uncharacterized oligopeptide transporter (OPT) family protein
VFAEIRHAPAAVKALIVVAILGLLLSLSSTLSSPKHIKGGIGVIVFGICLYLISFAAIVVARRAWAWWFAVIVDLVGALRGPVAGLAPFFVTLVTLGLLLTNSVRRYTRVHLSRFRG